LVGPLAVGWLATQVGRIWRRCDSHCRVRHFRCSVWT
jgi:hypothetical protein